MTIIDKLNKDDIFAEDEYLRLRKLTSEDRADYFQVLKQVSPVPEIFNLDGFEDLLWKETLSSGTEMTLAIEKKAADAHTSAEETAVQTAGQTETGGSAGDTAGPIETRESGQAPVSREEKKNRTVYVGECMVKNPEPFILELGVDVGSEYQNRGIGTRAMRLLITGIRQRCPGCRLIARIYSDNVKSIHIIRKLGGMKIAEEPGEHKEAAAVAAAAGRQSKPSSPGLPGSVHIEVFEILP